MCERAARATLIAYLGREVGSDLDDAVAVLRAYLHAAALAGSGVNLVRRWLRDRAVDEPARIIREHGTVAGWATELELIGRHHRLDRQDEPWDDWSIVLSEP